MKTNLFLVALPSHDNRLVFTQKILACEAKRSPLIKVQWTHTNDLHIILGALPQIEESDMRSVALAMSSVSQNAPFMVNTKDIRIYGNTIVLRPEPQHPFMNIYKKTNQKLAESTDNKYQFQTKERFDPHIVLGRIKNLQSVNPLHKQQFLHLLEEQFKTYSFLIQQAALVHRLPENAHPAYQTIQPYPLRRG